MGATAAVARPPAQTPPRAEHPPGNPPGTTFEPVLQAEHERPAHDPNVTKARPAQAEGSAPEADDPGAAASPGSTGSPGSATRPDTTGAAVSRAAHEAKAAGEPVPAAVHAVLAAVRDGTPTAVEPMPAAPVPVEDAPVDPILTPPPPAGGARPDEPVPVPPDPVPLRVEGEAALLQVPGADAQAPESAPAGQASPSPVAATPTAVAPATAPAPAPGPSPEPAPQLAVASASGSGPVEAEPAPGRPGHVPENGRGAEMRREDPPAHGWRRTHDGAPAGRSSSPEPVVPAPVAPPPPGAPPAEAASPEHPQQTGAPPHVLHAPERAESHEGVALRAPDAPVRAGSRLAELAETARTVIRIAALDGRTTARITLHPAELGEVQIRLRYEAAGISAEVVAESRPAMLALQEAGADLRRSLEEQGLNLLWLEVRHGGGSGGTWLGRGGADPDRTESEDSADPEERAVPAERLVAAGSTIDVLA